ncbi:MAG: anti-sigma factor [Symploca sp. SIO2E6]|nr:anti-sigma factor [Symploca sp. SIO2E6]
MSDIPKSYNLQELLAGYVLGDLDEAELAWLKQQLAVNPQLEEEIQQIQETLALMPYGLADEVPSQDLRSRILASAANLPQQQPGFLGKKSIFPSYPHEKPGFLNRLAWLIAAITTCSTIWFGFSNYKLRYQLTLKETEVLQQQELTALLSQPNNRLLALKGIEQTTAASGSLFIVPEQQKAMLVIQNLQPLPDEKVYRLWAVSQGQKTGCINFKPDEQGLVTVELSPKELTNAQSVLITVESQPDTFQPTGNPVITSYQSL